MNKKDQVILVTGGAGFIGSNFIKYWHQSYPNDLIICYDALTYAGNTRNIEENIWTSNNFKFIHGDIRNEYLVEDTFKKFMPHIVVNFAAESHVDRSIERASDFISTNIQGVDVLMNTCLKYDVLRFHQVSTDEVYGDLPLDRPDLVFNETSLLRPSNPYAASKASADLLVQSYIRTHGLKATISRSTNNYGINQHKEKLIPTLIMNALNNENLPIYGNGNNVRDWIWVEDHCRAIDLIIRDGNIGEIYNIGANDEICNKDVAKLILNAIPKSSSRIVFVKDRPGHDLRYALDISKISEELDWKPSTHLRYNIDSLVAYYMNEYK